MPYIVILQRYYGPYDGAGQPYAKMLSARDIEDARGRAEKLARLEPKRGAEAVEIIAVFDALAGAIGPDVQKEYD